MFRPLLCLLLVALCAVAVHPPIVAACCLTVDAGGCCGPSNECCRVVQLRDAATAPSERLVDPGVSSGHVDLPTLLEPAAATRGTVSSVRGRDDRPPPDSAHVRTHLALSILRV